YEQPSQLVDSIDFKSAFTENLENECVRGAQTRTVRRKSEGVCPAYTWFEGSGTYSWHQSLFNSADLYEQDSSLLYPDSDSKPGVYRVNVHASDLCLPESGCPASSDYNLDHLSLSLEQETTPGVFASLDNWIAEGQWQSPDICEGAQVKLTDKEAAAYISGKPIRILIKNTEANPFGRYFLRYKMTVEIGRTPGVPWPRPARYPGELSPLEVQDRIHIAADSVESDIYTMEILSAAVNRSDTLCFKPLVDPNDVIDTMQMYVLDADGNAVGAQVNSSGKVLKIDLSDPSLSTQPYEMRMADESQPINGTLYLCPAGTTDCGAYDPRWGACGPGCTEDDLCCIDPATNDRECRDVINDAMNCGGCDNACDWDQECLEGVCARVDGRSCWSVECPDEMECCQEGILWWKKFKCRSLKTDNDNCGLCGIKCPCNMTCVNGLCIPKHDVPCDMTCWWGKSCCYILGFVTCVDLDDNPHHCGSCATECDSGDVCEDGRCVDWTVITDPCPSGQTNCGGEDVDCKDTQTDPQNCGICGMICPDNAWCEEGQCALEGEHVDVYDE
ncbi:MAG: hypothetical protein GY847_29375, partial [Proteobacteria bacterium]|nr:hypothetical protein [Pseudomonadota bacterium]